MYNNTYREFKFLVNISSWLIYWWTRYFAGWLYTYFAPIITTRL